MAAIAEKQPPDDESELVRRAIKGDAEAFGSLYERYLDAIYRYLYFRMGEKSLVEDLTEEVFVRAWESLPRYKMSKHPFKSWLYRIAHNLYVDIQRKNTPVLISDEDMDRKHDNHQLPEEVVTQQQDFELLAHALKKLDDVAQQVILLRFVDGLSHRQVGKIIGKSVQASRVIQHRALNTLHTYMVQEDFLNG